MKKISQSYYKGQKFEWFLESRKRIANRRVHLYNIFNKILSTIGVIEMLSMFFFKPLCLYKNKTLQIKQSDWFSHENTVVILFWNHIKRNREKNLFSVTFQSSTNFLGKIIPNIQFSLKKINISLKYCGIVQCYQM